MHISLSVFHPADLPEVLILLRSELPAHEISESLFVRKVLLDPNFDPDGAVIARNASNNMVGFLLALSRKSRLEGSPDDRNRAWITLFAVHRDARRKHVASLMFDTAESRLLTRQATEIWISPYTPNYWTPGVDEAAYPTALDFLKSRGYSVASRPLAMAASLSDSWQIPSWAISREHDLTDAVDLRIEPITPAWILPLMQFLSAGFPRDWQCYVTEAVNAICLGYRCSADVMVAICGSEVVGFAHADGDRFGPFGVGKAQRGKGIGALLLYRTMESMRSRGAKRAWFMWTGDGPAKRVYVPAGFIETNRYSILTRALK